MNDTPADKPTREGDEPGPSTEAGEPAEPDPALSTSARTVEVSGAPGLTCDVDFSWLGDRLRDAVPLLEGRFERVIERVAVQVVDDARMVELQSRYHPPADGAATTTDVLTFDLSSAGGPLVADIAICVDEARRRAAELGHGADRELALYALHGVLHCMGLDDHDAAGFESMHAEEDRILEAIGVGATFRTGEAGS